MSRYRRRPERRRGSPIVRWIAETLLITAAARVIRRMIRGR